MYPGLLCKDLFLPSTDKLLSPTTHDWHLADALRHFKRVRHHDNVIVATSSCAHEQAKAMTAMLSVDQVLRLDQNHLARFVKDNLSDEDDALDISNIADWERVSQATRDRLAEQLLTAVQKTVVPSINPRELATLLARIPSDRSSPSPHTTSQYVSSSRSSTVEPTEGEAREYQARCYRVLLDDGCRPLFPLGLLPQVSTDTDAYRDMLRPWTNYPDAPSPQDWDVFSRQLRRWKEYRAWQLVNRRQTVGFSEYLDEKRREFERMGASEFTADPVFEQTVHHQWEDEYGRGRPQRDDDDAEAVLSKYAAAASRLLIGHGFVKPFRLQADPRQQDQWTTYVEYLAFECFCLGKLAASARKLRPQHDAEWEKLVRAGVVRPLDTCDDLASAEAEAMRLRELEKAARAVRSFTAATGTTTTTTARKASTTNARGKRRGTRRGQEPPTHAPKSLQSAQTHLDDITRRNELVDEYLYSTQKYRTAKAEADYQQRRVEWVLSEISKIEAEQKAGKGSSSGGTGSRKRKRTTNDVVEARVEKQRRTDETMAGGSYNSRTTRSKRRKCPTDEDTSEPQFKTHNMAAGESDGPGTGRRKRPKGTPKTDDSAAPPGGVQEPEPGPGPAAATTESRTRRQSQRIFCGDTALGSRADRLKTLRPGLDKKVAGASRLQAQGGGGAALGATPKRKARGRPRSTHGLSKVT